MRLNWPLTAALLWELACDVGRLALALHEEHAIFLAIGRIMLTMTLGWLALFRGTAWAGWIFAGFQYLGAGAMAFLSVFSLEGGDVGFYPVPFAFFLLYLALGIAATYGVVHMRPRRHSPAEMGHDQS